MNFLIIIIAIGLGYWYWSSKKKSTRSSAGGVVMVEAALVAVASLILLPLAFDQVSSLIMPTDETVDEETEATD
jgi:hypothetical protein